MRKAEEDYATVMRAVMPIIAEVFSDQNGTPWVAVSRNGTIVIMALESEDFAELVTAASMVPDQQGFGDSGLAMPCSTSVIRAVRRALRLLARKNQRELFLRYGWQDEKLIADLGDTGYTVFEVDKNGCRPASLALPPFFRTKNQAFLPYPDTPGDFTELKKFLPFTNDVDQIVVMIFAATVPFVRFERPVLVIYGPPSSGKSKATHIVRDSVDPQIGPPVDMPADKKGLIVNFAGCCLPAFDNANEIISVSCQSVFSGSVTGFSHTERQYYTNYGAATISFRRASIVNGLGVPFTKEDLLSRCLLIKTQKLSNEMDASALWAEFEKCRASIFGGMLQAISEALKILPKIQPIPPDLIRFRDWARVAIALGTCFGIPREHFLEVLAELKQRRHGYVTTVVGVCAAVCKLMEHPHEWKVRNKGMTPDTWVGTAAELLGELEALARKHRIELAEWPKGAAQLGMRLDSVASELGTKGIVLKPDEKRTGKNRDRFIRIIKNSEGNPPS